MRRSYHPCVRKITWRRKWDPLQYSCLENPMDRGAWRAKVHGVLKELDMTEHTCTWSRTHSPDHFEKEGKTNNFITSTWWFPSHPLHTHLWIPTLFFCWPDNYSWVSSLLGVLCFHPELSPGEYQCLIPPEIVYTGQPIPHPDPTRSHSLWGSARMIRGERITHAFWWDFSTPLQSWHLVLRDHGSRRSKDRVAHIRRCWRCRSSLVSELQKVADAASDSAWNGERCRYWLSGGRV